jgi:hypothetical protein
MEENDKVTAFVAVHDGNRLGWKMLRGVHPQGYLSSKYFGFGPDRPPREACSVKRVVVDDWVSAMAWCASFQAHPAEDGEPPVSDADG